jgi:hypothetical protein
MPDRTVLILGGAGLVGRQCAKKIGRTLGPERIVIASLFRKETRETVAELRKEMPQVDFLGYYGNLFVRGRPTPIDRRAPEPSPREFADQTDNRRAMFEDLFEDFEAAFHESCLVRLILEVRPDAVVDTVNTATGISYQDAFSSSFVVARGIREACASGERLSTELEADVEKHLISAAVPQLILHIRLLARALAEAGTRIYVKIGTTGTGGMGLNIPYTHGEDKPSPTLMSKTATAFAHTGLLFLMARTPGCPIIKEIKPAAMIGYREIGFHQVKGTQVRPSRNGEPFRWVADEPYVLWRAREQPLGETLDNEPTFDGFQPLEDDDGRQLKLSLPCVNTGENGTFARGEFEAITALGQMEFVTPEEIADLVSLELQGSNTGRDVISSIDSSILSPSYKGGLIRSVAVEELEKLEQERGVPSVAIGQLGPPQLAKYLWEVHFLKELYGTVEAVLHDEEGTARRGADVAEALEKRVLRSPLRHTITSVGIPILLADGKTILRGPWIRIPPYNKKAHVVALGEENRDRFANRGWIDLRPAHASWWLEQFRSMRRSLYRPGAKWSSERLDTRSYLAEEIRIGEVVAWIFNNQLDPPGRRIK